MPDFTVHAVVKRQMRGYGGMLTIEANGSSAAAARVAGRARLIAPARGRGGIESLISHPIVTPRPGQTSEQPARRGISALPRLSIGLKVPAGLLADVERTVG